MEREQQRGDALTAAFIQLIADYQLVKARTTSLLDAARAELGARGEGESSEQT